jgi:molecular chaperone IbpA
MNVKVPYFDPHSFLNISKASIGFDDIISKLNDANKTFTPLGYPPYNIKRADENTYYIEMAVAGFGQNDIEITRENDFLIIRGAIKKNEKEDECLFKGIAERSFIRNFTLADTVIVKKAELVNGMLTIWLERQIPEAKKPQKITILQKT